MRKFALATIGAVLWLASMAGGGTRVRGADGDGVAAGAVTRVWTDNRGLQLTATLYAFDGTTVKLQKKDGTILPVAIEKMSSADQQYLRRLSAGAKKPAEKPPEVANAGATAAKPDAPPMKPQEAGPSTPQAAGKSELELKCEDLCEQITTGYKAKETGAKPTIAVVEFSDLSGNVTDLGRLLSEELITKLFSTGKYKVVERLLLNKVIAEHKLQVQGIVDPKSAKALREILGVDAIVSGTIADLGDSLLLNSRLISTETAEVQSAASTTIRKDDTVKRLASASASNPADASPTTGEVAAHRSGNAKLPLREDFSAYNDGDKTEWGSAAKVATGVDGRKWLVPADKGQKSIGLDLQLPENAYIEFDYSAYRLESRKDNQDVLSGITLVDEAGAKFRIEWTVHLDSIMQPSYILKLPGGTSVRKLGHYSGGTVRLRKAGNTITVARDGDDGLTADVSDFKKFTRFEVDIYKGQNCAIWFTNFKIGTTLGGTTKRK